MGLLETVKEHPLMIGGAVVVLLLVTRSGGGSSSDGSAAAIQSQSIATNADVALSGINADASKARAQYSSAMFQAVIAGKTAMAINNDNNFTSMYLGKLSADNTKLSIVSALDATKTVTASNQAIAFDTQEKQLDSLKIKTNAATDLALKAMAEEHYQFSQNLSSTMNNLPALLKHAQALATIDKDKYVAIAQTNNQAAVTTAENGGTMDIIKTIGSVAGAVMAFL